MAAPLTSLNNASQSLAVSETRAQSREETAQAAQAAGGPQPDLSAGPDTAQGPEAASRSSQKYPIPPLKEAFPVPTTSA